MNQLSIHKKILEFIKAGIENADFQYLKKDLLINDDADQYFYAHIDATWIDELQKQQFFEALNVKAKDITTYSYRMPELAYLTNIASVNPEGVADIILSTKISADNFNPEVVERFLWIATKLPAIQLSRVVEKMKAEKWVVLMKRFRKTGYEFSEMVETLKKENDWEGLINFAKAILVVRDKREDKYSEGVFYVSEVHASGIFEALDEIDDSEKSDEVLQFLIMQFGEIIKNIGSKYNVGEYPFEYEDPFGLYDSDLFTFEAETNKMRSFHADEKNFSATLVRLLRDVSGYTVDDVWESLKNLPTSRLTWKVQLVFLVTHQAWFPNEIYEALNYLFELGGHYYAIFSGSEYKEAVGRVFSTWTNEQQEGYVKKLVGFFNDQKDSHPDQNWHARNAVQLLSIISANVNDLVLKESLENYAEEVFGLQINELYKPEPSIQHGMAGIVQHKSPFIIADYLVEDIFDHLRTDWAPEKLKEEYKNDDYLKPRGAEGLGNELRDDLKNRLGDYLAIMNATGDYKDIHPHYVYSLMRGLEELLKDQNKIWNKQEIESVLAVLLVIKEQGDQLKNPKTVEDSWLGSWVWAKRSIADTLIYIIELRDKGLRKEIHDKYKKEILGLIEYLFDTPESPNAEEEKPEYGDPFHVAINSVRGRVYQGFVVYAENDGEKLSEESKEFFKKALGDKSVAVRFVIGHYLPSLYYRDKEFITGLLDVIFPRDKSDKLATWEGYSCSPLYEELYKKLAKYYEWAISLDSEDYPDRKTTKDLDEALATHIALAFVHFYSSHTDGLAGLFLGKKDSKRVGEFVTFIGRSYFTSDHATKTKLEETPGGIQKFLDVWDWVIKQNLEPEAYAGFGFWINTNILEVPLLVEKIEKTFEVSGGAIDWDYKFEKSLKKFAEVEPAKTLGIIRNYLLGKDGELNRNRRFPMFGIEGEIKHALEVIYKNQSLRPKVEDLINELIEKGSQMFWGLESVLE